MCVSVFIEHVPPEVLSAYPTLFLRGSAALRGGAVQGSWVLTRVTAEEYKDLVKGRAAPQHWNHSLGNPGPQDKTLFSIEQDVAPAVAHRVPPWLHGLLRRICASAVNDVYHVRRPRLSPLLSVAHVCGSRSGSGLHGEARRPR